MYPEAGSYKFRLKASNGEILAVSFRYTTEKGAITGIETFKKNVASGVFEIYTDKSGFAAFNLYNQNKARIMMVGEFYTSEKLAESAVESVKRFYDTERIDILSKIADSEIREELLVFEKIDTELQLVNMKYIKKIKIILLDLKLIMLKFYLFHKVMHLRLQPNKG